MSGSNDVSLLFASDIGNETLEGEPFLYQPNLYTDLDQLERSVEAEFELYLNQARSFPFNQELPHESSEHQSSQPRQSISPGAYFGARSLPLTSIWSQQHNSTSEENESIEEPKTETEKLLALRFKSLPKKIHSPLVRSHPAHHTKSTQTTLNLPKPCLIEPPPSSPLYFVCEMSKETVYVKVIHLKLTNPNPDTCSFALFSAEQLLEFDQKEGSMDGLETIEIKVSVKASTLGDHPLSLSDKLLVLIDTDQVHQYEVQVDYLISSPSDHSIVPTGRPKCRYCALEQGYPLYSLS
ncbi:hypothetical protein BD560DRAFT_414532 [Blakeslea trispora]|nr:hypothetical protein BD560DRAFT_414532 [Blakeslea trispora]